MSERIACAILAAGSSRRLGRPKQLLTHAGRPLVAAVCECVCLASVAARAVVIGAHGAAVRAALEHTSVEVLRNVLWREGIASSIRTAVSWAERRACSALLIALCDQPRLTLAHLERLIAEHAVCQLPVASHYAGRNGVPALFPRAYFNELRALIGDRGAGPLLNGAWPVVSVAWPDGEFDVDTPEAAQRLSDS